MLEWLLRTFLVVAVVLIAPSVQARDGVREINQACAETAGCLPGDETGFPVSITAAGSYLLTSNLTLPDENTTGIEILADFVTLDLNGFSVLGTTMCTIEESGAAPTCTPLGTGNGIADPDQSRAGTVVRNGVVARAGERGIVLGPHARVQWLRVISNGSTGVLAGPDSRFEDNVAYLNGATGLAGAAGATFLRNVATDNASQGINATLGAVVADNVVARNENGILVDDGASVTRNVATQNRNDGIEGDHGVTAIGNLSFNNAGHGIRCKDGCQVTRNVAYGNAFQQLKLGTDSIYSYNSLAGGTGDAAGGVAGIGNN